jgi:alpha-galactosidase
MKVVDRKVQIGSVPQFLYGSHQSASISEVSKDKDIAIYKLHIEAGDHRGPIAVSWKLSADEVKGIWTPGALLDKRIRADWEMPQLSSRVSVDAPVVSAFSHTDANVLTVSCSDTVNTIDFEAAYREEDDMLYFKIVFLTEDLILDDDYNVYIRIDSRNIPYYLALQETAAWFEEQVAAPLAFVPNTAQMPLYSTWYSYHQDFTETQLLEECRLSKEMGYEVIVVDDGWQTLDSGRGYDYTGDWRPERIANMKEFADAVHQQGMKLMLWYSVPFCGRKSEAYKRFKGKFLTENHHWAPVFDVRFPEVRAYLVTCYSEALEVWNVDGLKLDFIDDFKIYPETELRELKGRDVLSVNKGVELLVKEVKEALTAINPEVLIEFRQKYISPSLRILGNMFRAFDCPFDSVMNRVRTTDVKLLCGASAVHSDMLTWNKNVRVEIAAMQFTSILFSVPQLSIRLTEAPKDHLKMIRFYTDYWRTNREILLTGKFEALKPLSNYPLLKASAGEKQIIGVYEDCKVNIGEEFNEVDLINGKEGEELVLCFADEGQWQVKIYDCTGEVEGELLLDISKNIELINVSSNGLVKLKKI